MTLFSTFLHVKCELFFDPTFSNVKIFLISLLPQEKAQKRIPAKIRRKKILSEAKRNSLPFKSLETSIFSTEKILL